MFAAPWPGHHVSPGDADLAPDLPVVMAAGARDTEQGCVMGGEDKRTDLCERVVQLHDWQAGSAWQDF